MYKKYKKKTAQPTNQPTKKKTHPANQPTNKNILYFIHLIKMKPI